MIDCQHENRKAGRKKNAVRKANTTTKKAERDEIYTCMRLCVASKGFGNSFLPRTFHGFVFLSASGVALSVCVCATVCVCAQQKFARTKAVYRIVLCYSVVFHIILTQLSMIISRYINLFYPSISHAKLLCHVLS